MSNNANANAFSSRGTKTLLIGHPGSGKTTALAQFIVDGLHRKIDPHLFAVITEPEGEEALVERFKTLKLSLDRLHLCYIPPVAVGFQTLRQSVKFAAEASYKDLTASKAGPGRQFNQLDKVYQAMINFTDDRTGEQFGSVEKFPQNYMLAIDSLTGLNYMAFKVILRNKLTAAPGEWGVAMNIEEDYLVNLVSTVPCFVTVTGHIDRELDEVLGKPQNFPAMLGKKLAPKVPRFFSDVVLAYRQNKSFRWSTIRADYECLKARNLPLSDQLTPSFLPMIDRRIQPSAAESSAESSTAKGSN